LRFKWVLEEPSSKAQCVGIAATIYIFKFVTGLFKPNPAFSPYEALAFGVYDQKMVAEEEPPLGEHWKTTDYPVLYQLSRRVEFIAEQMRIRRSEGHAPLVKHVKELAAIAVELKSLDSRTGKTQSPEDVFRALHPRPNSKP
jgi:hypothetical protein